MKNILNLLLSICILKKGPQDLPASYVLVILLLTFYSGLSTVNLMLTKSSDVDLGPGSALLTVIVHAVLIFSMIVILMWLLGYKNRIPQTLAAMIGVDVVISGIQFPFSYIKSVTPAETIPFTMITLVLLIWSVSIYAHILRHALSINMLNASMLSIAIYFLSLLMFSQLLAV